MEEVAQVVLLERRLVLGKDRALRRVLSDRESLGVEPFPVLDRYPARVEQLDVGAERPADVRDRLVARLPGGVTSHDPRDRREPVARLRLGRIDHRVRQLLTSEVGIP